ncbi:hypothetical protein I547_0117 [Mycobacterium kansasii 824]|uniref:Uncharacterized protein n=1 Tax=Mycobacterium kansasii TaxID=1768 RepID=A0A1V3XSD2_MYCKA|nr:hypothetical protein I547_0117 [Mycobacterium kansasii 824]OOK82127.1 hypothetical protein BZL30_0469 [Mycobacterium kansasii]OOK84564.1 hypothetical protein BZL29_1367 [Mycobacterium kansasii]
MLMSMFYTVYGRSSYRRWRGPALRSTLTPGATTRTATDFRLVNDSRH